MTQRVIFFNGILLKGKSEAESSPFVTTSDEIFIKSKRILGGDRGRGGKKAQGTRPEQEFEFEAFIPLMP